MAGEDDSVAVEARSEALALRLMSRILAGCSLYQAARLEDIPYSTARQLFARPKHAEQLRMALEEMRDGIVSRARVRLEASVDAAVDALVEVIEGEGRLAGGDIMWPKPRDRVVAATALLDRVGIHPRRTVEHVERTEQMTDAELFQQLVEAVQVLRGNGEAIPVEVVELLPPGEPDDDLLATASTPPKKPAKVKRPNKQPSQPSRKKTPTKPAKKKRKT